MWTVPSESRNQPSVCPSGRLNVGSWVIARHDLPSCDVIGVEPSEACGNWMSATSPRAVTGAWLLRMNAVTSTTVESVGTPVTAFGVEGAIWITTASLNEPACQSNSVSPSADVSVSPACGTAFFSTGGATGSLPVGSVVGGTQMVKWERMLCDWPLQSSVPVMMYRPDTVVANVQFSFCPVRGARAVFDPSGRVTVMPVQLTGSFAFSVIAATEPTVEPSAGDAEMNAGPTPPPVPVPAPLLPPLGGTTMGVWFVAVRVNGATSFVAASCSALSAGTA